MEKFARLTAQACPLDWPNIDTDQILPARFLKTPRGSGLGHVLFHDLRFDAEGQERPFPLNAPAWRGARILVAPQNFGVGSSREAAVYALADYGIRCVIAPSFGDIFAGNAVKNGLLTARVPAADAQALLALLSAEPGLQLTVDLEAQSIVEDDKTWPFVIDAVVRTRLINGWDDLDLTRTHQDRIAAFREVHFAETPGAMPGR